MEEEELERFNRRSAPDENGMVNIIEYKCKSKGTGENEETKVYVREARRVKLVVRDAGTDDTIQERKRWKYRRFGAAAGAVGPEPGITTISHEEYFLLDPWSEEANMTGEDKLLEKIKQKVISHGNRDRASELMPERYGQSPNTGGRRSNSRASMNKSPFRSFEPGPGRNSPGINFSSNSRNYGHEYQQGQGQGQGRNSPNRNYNVNRRGHGRQSQPHSHSHNHSGRKSHGRGNSSNNSNSNNNSNRGRKSPGPGRGGYRG
mmetsp:Transcript_10257/g.13348  ORF Transcript_10257/g.13348 Transcript_10257/m.13348 type:complete len:261 (+) Transcript_10257:159-941(+)